MNTRPLSTLHLIFGLIFLGLAGLWTLVAAGVVHNVRAELVLPLLLIAAGGVGLIAFVTTTMRRDHSPLEPSSTPIPTQEVTDDTAPIVTHDQEEQK